MSDSIRKRVLLVLLTGFIITGAGPSYAQVKRNNYALLWKISGKGLSAPSYLFGTMHIKDKRVFQFSDSVLTALNHCEAFAMEITPDSILQALFNRKKEDKDPGKLKKYLSDEEYKELDERLKKETGVGLDNMKSQDPWIIQNLLNRVPVKKDDYTAFLDAHLYYLARLSGKSIYGLEKVSEQTDVLDQAIIKSLLKNKTNEDRRKEEEYYNRLVDLYYQGDITEINRFISQSATDDSFAEKVINGRNKVMESRIDTLIRKKAAFIAIGAAHLPGDQGIISLLRKEGYQVEKVPATFSGNTTTLVPDEANDKWQTFSPEEGSFTVEMPSRPFPYDLGENNEFTLYMYPDMGSGINYYACAFNSRNNLESIDQEAFFKKFANQLAKSKGMKVLESTAFQYEKQPGREFRFYSPKENQFMRCRIILKENTAFLLLLGGTKEQLASKSSSRFFNSFKIEEQKPTVISEYVSTKGGFKVKMPSVIKESENSVESEGTGTVKLHNFTSTDTETGTSYAIVYTEYQPGIVFTDEALYYENAITNIAKKAGGTILSLTESEIGDYPAKEFIISTGSQIYKAKLALRGARGYILMAIAAPNQMYSPRTEDFFNSFAFIPYETSSWNQEKVSEYGFKVTVPSPFVEEKDTTITSGSLLKRSVTYTSLDPNSGTSYIVVGNTYNDYYESYGMDSLFAGVRKSLQNEQDSIVKDTAFAINGMTAHEYIVNTNGNYARKRIRVIPRGEDIFYLITILPKNELYNPQANAFLNSFISERLPKMDLTSRKVDKLLADLASADSIIQKNAHAYLYNYNFRKEDLPLLYQALNKEYTETNQVVSGIREDLLEVLFQLNDSTTAPFIASYYKTLPASSPLRARALRVLAGIKSAESVKVLKDILVADPPANLIEASSIFNPLYDSLVLARTLYPQVLSIVQLPAYKIPVYRLMVVLADSNLLKYDDYKDYKPRILKDCALIAEQRKVPRELDDNFYKVSFEGELLANILRKFPEGEERDMNLYQLTKDKDNNVVLAAVKGLLANNKPVDAKTCLRLAADPKTRLELFEILKKEKKIALFPPKYHSQKSFAESKMLNWLTAMEAEPDGITLLKEKKVSFKGEKGIIYVFKFHYRDDETKNFYWGVSGLYPSDKEKLDPLIDVTRSDFKSASEISESDYINFVLNQ